MLLGRLLRPSPITVLKNTCSQATIKSVLHDKCDVWTQQDLWAIEKKVLGIWNCWLFVIWKSSACLKQQLNNLNIWKPLRDGKNQNEKTFGLPSEEIFSAIYRFVWMCKKKNVYNISCTIWGNVFVVLRRH